MTTRPTEPIRPDAAVAPSLELIADSVATISGFGIAVIREARADGLLHVLALAGTDAPLVADRLDQGTPIADLERVIGLAEDWGPFRFVAGERLGADVIDRLMSTGTQPSDDPGAWQPHDVLVAPLTTSDGTLIGTLDLDLPADGRRPDLAKRAALNTYAVQAGRAVVTHLERNRLAREIEQAQAARRVIRASSFAVSEQDALRECAPALLECFGSDMVVFWLADRPDTDVVFRPDGTERTAGLSFPGDFHEVLTMFDERRDIGIIGFDQTRNAEYAPDVDAVLERLRREGHSSALYAPIGSLGTLYGGVVIMRPVDGPLWTESEIATILSISGDLGRALQNARDLQREQAVVRELRQVDRYRSDLLRTVSHELKNPLTSILGNIELLRDEDDPAALTRTVSTIERGADRLARTIADLTTYSAVGGAMETGPVDLAAVVRDACDLLVHAAGQRSIELSLHLPAEPVLVQGEAALLDRVVVNLVSNALKYTPPDGAVTVTLLRVGGPESMVELAVADTGIGIADEDQGRLFRSYFRSSDQRAAAQPGTGLGLAISQRIVDRLGGSITVKSRLDHGSVFRVLLPESRP